MSHTEQDLKQALHALQTSSIVIYNNFEPLFKLIGLMLLGYVVYRLGRVSVSEPISDKAKSIDRSIRKIEAERVELPTRIATNKSRYRRLIVLLVVVIAAVGALVDYRAIIANMQYLGPLAATPIIAYIISAVHLSVLRAKTSQFVDREKQIRDSVKELNSRLGAKVQNNLKNTLCRDKILARQSKPSQICTKKECQQMREALKTKYQAIRVFAEAALQFEWCSVCKQRKPFDELIRFEARPMPDIPADISEQEEADIKINYLLQTLEEADKWIVEAGPCNCTKLYMEQILTTRRQYQATLKQSNARIAALEKEKQINAGRLESKDSNASQEAQARQVRTTREKRQ